ncbi:MAG: response regulator [Synechococcales bacterium]|nr:response regulator [Synechococcales bacterium]
MRILLVEDDESLVEVLTKALSQQNYVVDVALDGATGWEMAQVYPYSLILLDVNLPGLDGITLCRQLRECQDQTLVMLLTARDSITDRILGLNSGADDYVIKPFDIHEVSARIRALLRREATLTPTCLTCGQLTLDPNTREVSFAEQPLPVSRKEYLLIELFLRHQQRVFSRSDIIDHLWSAEEDPPTEETVKSHIKSLRRKLKKFDAADWIETLYGQGYRVNPKYLDPTEVWQRTHQASLDRIVFLEYAVASLKVGTWDESLRSRSIQEAHRLSGTLATLGFDLGAQIARQLESLLQSASPDLTNPDPQIVHQFESGVNALHAAVSQPQPTPPLPDKQAPLANGVSTPPPLQQNPPKARILQVDDDPQMLSVVDIILSSFGLQVTGLEDGTQFWAKLQATQPDLLILDVNMPAVSGLELCKAVRQHPSWHWLPIIVFTVQADAASEQQAFAVGADDYLLKPIQPENLSLRVLNRLQRCQSRRRSPIDTTSVLQSELTILPDGYLLKTGQ